MCLKVGQRETSRCPIILLDRHDVFPFLQRDRVYYSKKKSCPLCLKVGQRETSRCPISYIFYIKSAEYKTLDKKNIQKTGNGTLRNVPLSQNLQLSFRDLRFILRKH